MMVRHLLALFALLSGIAALQAPAHAGEVQSSVQNARSVAGASEQSASESCDCASRERGENKTRPRREKRTSWSWLPAWLRPSVLLGSDRALE